MSEPERSGSPQPGLPAPDSVLRVFTLQRPATIEAAAAGTPSSSETIYEVLRTDLLDPYDTRPALIAAALGGAAVDTLVLEQTLGEHYTGKARKAAKISISPADTESFSDLTDLISTLPEETQMTDHDPPIKDTEVSERVPEEHRNVRVRGFLYAAKREEDNDFHLIIGTDPSPQPVCLNVELSGTPPESSNHFERLKAARDAFKAFFLNHPNGIPGFGYDFYPTPIPVEIQGSLFFDITHATGGRPGPDTLRRFIPVIWEIHPISEIVLGP
jgi:hypothetical protein